AKRAAALLAYDEAGDQYRHALELLELGEPDDTRRLDLLLALGDENRRAGDVDRATEAFHQAAALAKKLEHPEKLARAALGNAGRWIAGGLGDDLTRRLLKEALAALPEQDSALRACVMARLAPELFWSTRGGSYEEAFAMSRE